MTSNKTKSRTRISVIILIMVLVVALLMVLGGCGNAGGGVDSMPELDAAVEAQIRQDLYKQYGRPFGGMVYYGTFNGAVVLFSEGDTPTEMTMFVAGVLFVNQSGFTISVWYRNEFLSLDEAFRQKILTRREIRTIRDTHRINTAIGSNT